MADVPSVVLMESDAVGKVVMEKRVISLQLTDSRWKGL